MVWDGTRARLFASAGSTIVMINPETGDIEDTITSGEIAGKIAVSSDGQYLFAAIGSRGVIKRYRVQTHAEDLVISLGKDSQGRLLTAAAMVGLPDRPESIMLARGYWPSSDNNYFPIDSQNVVVYDGTTQRPDTLVLNVNSLHVRTAGGTIHGWSKGFVHRFQVTARGVALDRSTSISALFSKDSLPVWNGGLLMDRAGAVFDLETGTMLGAPTISSGCALVPDSSGRSILAVNGSRTIANSPASLVQYSVDSFRPTASAGFTPDTEYFDACVFTSFITAWGSDGIAIVSQQRTQLVLLRTGGLEAIAPNPPPEPQVDASGVIRLSIPANDLVFDTSRNLLWATVSGSHEQLGNSVVSIDPASGRILDAIPAGSEPGKVALSSDGSRLFVLSLKSPTISVLDLNLKQRARSLSVQDSKSWTPVSVIAVPDQNESVVVVRTSAEISYGYSITAYDGAVARPRSYTNLTTGAAVGALDTLAATSIYPGDAPDFFYGAVLEYNNGGGGHEAARFRIDAEGVSLDRRLGPVQLGDTSYFGVSNRNLVYESGNLFTSAGEVLSPDGRFVQGRFSIDQSYASSGIPIPFSDRNQVAYLHRSLLTSTAAVTVFDLATRRPVASIPIPGGGSAFTQFTAGSRAGSGALAASIGGQVMIIPLASLSPWPQSSTSLRTVAPGVQSLDLPVSAINAIPGSSKLLLTLPSKAGNIGNGVAVLNPDTGQIEKSEYMGSDPTLLATAPDGSIAYAYLSGEKRVARFNIASGSRDLVFVPDPTGAEVQYGVVDMVLGPDHALTTSIPGGWIATFDNGVLRPKVDKNNVGPGAFSGAPYVLALNPSGTIVYAFDNYWSLSDFRRDALTPEGVQFLSGMMEAPLYGEELKSAGGLLYTGNGTVFDPERSRVVGRMAAEGHVAPDPDAGRVYSISGGRIKIFDSRTYDMLASWQLPNNLSQVSPLDLVRFGSDGLAFHTIDGHLYLVRISAIPMLSAPVPSPQPALPSTPGVTVVDLATNDIAYDASRNVIYGTAPNSEGANGDRIAVIDPGSGAIATSWATPFNPKVLALSDDQSRLYFSSGTLGFGFLSGFSTNSEAVYRYNLSTGQLDSEFPDYTTSSGNSYLTFDIAALPGQSNSVAVIDGLTQSVNGGVATDVNALRIYDDGVSRERYLRPHSFSCHSMVWGESSSRMYCSDGLAIFRLAVDGKGVTSLNSIPLLPGRGSFGRMAFRNGRLFTTTGVVVEPEAGRVVTRVNANGAVAIDGNLVYWAEPSNSTQDGPAVTLRAFDIGTLQQVSSKRVKVTTTDVTRLIPCGEGRMAFRAGKEVYIVNP